MNRLVTAFVLSLVFNCAVAWAQESQELRDPLEDNFRTAASTVEDQEDVAVTIYNNNLALVRDRREVALFPGRASLAFRDVAQQIKPETVSLRSISEPGTVRILEQNYEFDLMSPSKLMEKYIGKDVRLVNFSTELGFSSANATLLSVNDGPIYQIDNEIYLGHPGNVVLPEIPENLVAKPSLIWEIESDSTDQTIEVTYLTNGVSWRADYVLNLNQEETQMDLAGWVTLTNQSGAQYTDAQLKVVAGDVHQVQEGPRAGQMKLVEMRAAAADAMQQEAIGEYHLYTLPRRTTIKQNQSKQVSLLTASEVNVRKHYELRGASFFFQQYIPEPRPQKVEAHLIFQNEEENNLGAPLPMGIMRVYLQDSEDMYQFVGEDRIDHTPKDEEVKLKLGNAFDIVGERVQTDHQRISSTVYETAFEITLRNHKTEAVTVDVVEPIPGNWDMVSNSHDFEKRDAFTTVFSAPVPADGETVVTYRVRIRTG